jgi:hypothetical protein
MKIVAILFTAAATIVDIENMITSSSAVHNGSSERLMALRRCCTLASMLLRKMSWRRRQRWRF